MYPGIETCVFFLFFSALGSSYLFHLQPAPLYLSSWIIFCDNRYSFCLVKVEYGPKRTQFFYIPFRAPFYHYQSCLYVLFLSILILVKRMNTFQVFDIISKLGEGSYGSVFKALHKDSKQILAIKQESSRLNNLFYRFKRKGSHGELQKSIP